MTCIQPQQMDPRSTEALHLLRALYRQTSCLFDDVARTHIKAQIRYRFHQCRSVDDPYRQSRLLKDGRHALSILQRANEGHQHKVFQVLQHAYGRVGRRRHALLAPLLIFPRNEPLIPGRRRSAPPATSPILAALLQSQQGKSFKTITPTIPELNAWNKPFPPTRRVNLLWRTHSDVLKRVLPPLCRDEFLRLECFAAGTARPIPPKRTHVVQQLHPPSEPWEKRTITKRFMMRTYVKLLRECPTMEFVGGRWTVVWSKVGSQRVGEFTDMEDFEGVNEQGLLPREVSKTALMKKRARQAEEEMGTVLWEAP